MDAEVLGNVAEVVDSLKALVTELKALITEGGFTPGNVLTYFIVGLIAWRFPAFLVHRREMHRTRNQFRLDSIKLHEKISTEREKRKRKLEKRK